MDQGDRPGGVREPVQRPPGAVSDAFAQKAGDQDREHQVQGDRAEAEPEGFVGGDERDDRVEDGDVDVAVDHRHRDVHGQERGRGEREAAVQGDRAEAGQAGEAGAQANRDAEQDHDREQDEADGPGGAVGVPEDLGAHAATASWVGQPGVVTTVPSWATKRAGRPRRVNQRSAPAPLTREAVLAALASALVAAATETVRQGLRTGRPVRGSTMWCSS